MVVGLDPWDENDPMMIYQKIIKGKIFFPKNMESDIKSFIQHLMVGDPKRRMGSSEKNGKNYVYSHPLFKGFNWNGLENKTISPWHIPKLKNLEDTSNYNEYSDSDSEPEEVPPSEDPFSNW